MWGHEAEVFPELRRGGGWTARPLAVAMRSVAHRGAAPCIRGGGCEVAHGEGIFPGADLGVRGGAEEQQRRERHDAPLREYHFSRTIFFDCMPVDVFSAYQ